MAYSSSLTQGVTLLIFLHIYHDILKQDKVSSKSLAERSGIPLPTTVKALKGLTAAGIINTKGGQYGGNILVKPLSQISLLDVFLSVEQDTSLFKMHDAVPCDHEFVSDLKGRLDFCVNKSYEAMKKSLESITLDQIYTGNF